MAELSRAVRSVRLLVVRHGESAWNTLGRWQGQADPPLSAGGEEQARLAAARLTDHSIAKVFASDLQRAYRTAQIMAAILGLPDVERHPELRETDVGAWSGLTRQEIEQRWPGMLAARARGRLQTPPGGETMDALARRVRAAIDLMVTGLLADGSRTALVVTHRGPISTLERSVGLEPARVGHLAGHWLEVDEELDIRHLGAAWLLDRSPEAPADLSGPL